MAQRIAVLKAEAAALRAQLAAATQWQPIAEGSPLVRFTRPFPTLVAVPKAGVLAVVKDSPDDTVTLFEHGPDFAFCQRRTPAAPQVAPPLGAPAEEAAQ